MMKFSRMTAQKARRRALAQLFEHILLALGLYAVGRLILWIGGVTL